MAEPSSARLTDAELWRGVEATVRDVLLPAINDDWARAAAIQLVGVARYAQRRPADTVDAQIAEVAAALRALEGNPLVQQPSSSASTDVLAAASAALVAAVDADQNDPATGAAVDEIRAILRPVLMAQLDDELVVTAPLVNAFRGKLDE